MPFKPRHHLRPWPSLLLSAALGCSSPAPEQEPSQAPASKASRLSTPGLPPGLAPSLVKDIQVGAATGYNPYGYGSDSFSTHAPAPVMLGSTLYFAAIEESTDQELWRTDGTPEGTRLVRELVPGDNHGLINGLAVLGDSLFVSTRSVSLDGTLWKSDGTAEGTVRFGAPGKWKNPSQLAACNGALFFQDFNPTYRLWKSDGTAEGTVELDQLEGLDSDPGPYLQRSMCVNGTLFFLKPGPGGEELWKSDGTRQGTVLLAELGYLSDPWEGRPLLSANSSHVFITGDMVGGFWTSDGTPEGTRRLGGINLEGEVSLFLFPQDITRVGETLYFTAAGEWSGFALWASDGTEAGTRRVTGLPEEGWHQPGLVSLGDTLLYASSSQVFRLDGTPEGTVLLDNLSLDLSPGESARLPDGRWLISSRESGGTYSLWVTDGSGAGTTKPQLAQGQGFMRLMDLKRHGDSVMFWADDGLHGMEPWVTDGTAEGTRMLRDIFRGDSSQPQSPLDVDGTLFFTAYDTVHGRELWKSDGTAEGTQLVKDIDPVPSLAGPNRLTRVGRTLFFFSRNQLWRSDGSEAGTFPVHTSQSGHFGDATGSLGPAFFFSTFSPTQGLELWTSDGTPEGTVLFADLHPGGASAAPAHLTQVGSTLFFTAHDGIHGAELWKTDGTPEGTVLVKDIRPGLQGGAISRLVNAGGTLFFTANDGLHGHELWKSDGTAEGTVLVADVQRDDSSVPFGLVAREGTVFFAADDGLHGYELWKSDGTAAGTRLVADLAPGTGSAIAPFYSTTGAPLQVIGGAVYFAADDGVHGTELWKSDGTAAGTTLLREFTPGAAGSALKGLSLAAAGPHGAFAFPAPDALGGLELWTSDGTTGGTRPLQDIAPGARGSSPAQLTVSGSRLFFVADEGEHGRELWSVKQAALHQKP